jgi:hypothetical protein
MESSLPSNGIAVATSTRARKRAFEANARSLCQLRYSLLCLRNRRRSLQPGGLSINLAVAARTRVEIVRAAENFMFR